MVKFDRFMDNKKDLEFEIALEEMERQMLNEKAQEAEWYANIGNPAALYGAI